MTTINQEHFITKNANLLILVAALGYFVDVYDLVLFGVVRIDSLKSLGIDNDIAIGTIGKSLLNYQMIGMMVGGFIWGIIGDKKGRLSVLFGSIIMYSIANILNGYVQTIEQYKILRFIAGIGLAGELGAGITLVAETMSKEKRGLGTMLVASIGVLGAVVASLIASKFQWRHSYIIGGVMGLLLLIMRIGVHESGMYKQIVHQEVRRGDLLYLFSKGKLLKKYLLVLAIGMPIWYTIHSYIFFSKEISLAMGMEETINPKYAIMFNYIGLCIGDICSGALSQLLQSRKKAILTFISLIVAAIFIFFRWGHTSLTAAYLCCGIIGFSTGYWAVFITASAEQFGTNLRSTVATTAPNVVRGSVYLVDIMVSYFAALSSNYIQGVLITGVFFIGIGFLATFFIQETFGKNLDFTE